MSTRRVSVGRVKLYVYQKVVTPLNDALKAGMTPTKLTLTIVLAIACGLFPVLGVTSLLCLLCSWRLHLNIPLMQAINFALTPVDLALSLPFMRLGEVILRKDPLPLTPKDLWAYIQEVGFWKSLGTISGALGCAILGWIVVITPVSIGLYYGLRPVLKRVMKKKRVEEGVEVDPLLRRRRSSSFDS
ncbi:hypothetical protein DFS34DRAFT_394814 [Phlyctochytrium arcticum]|nr:hypothetical protein DFS34DRAFT_394814 [Phlyctochytrium arcticum]